MSISITGLNYFEFVTYIIIALANSNVCEKSMDGVKSRSDQAFCFQSVITFGAFTALEILEDALLTMVLNTVEKVNSLLLTQDSSN